MAKRDVVSTVIRRVTVLAEPQGIPRRRCRRVTQRGGLVGAVAFGIDPIFTLEVYKVSVPVMAVPSWGIDVDLPNVVGCNR